MARRPRDAEATRLEILDAAESLFAKNGFGSTSLARIASASNVHKSLIMHHFESKEGLWQAVKKRRFSKFTGEQEEQEESMAFLMTAMLIAVALGIFAYVTGHSVFSEYLAIPYIAGAGELAIISSISSRKLASNSF